MYKRIRLRNMRQSPSKTAPVHSCLPPSRAAIHCFSAAFWRRLSRTRGRSAFIRASASAAPLAFPSAAPQAAVVEGWAMRDQGERRNHHALSR